MQQLVQQGLSGDILTNDCIICLLYTSTTALSAFLHHHNHHGITADPGKLTIYGAAHLYGTPLNFCRFLGDYLYYEFDICHR